eukprot:2838901-Alexandrium_andersonii.AAC.1
MDPVHLWASWRPRRNEQPIDEGAGGWGRKATRPRDEGGQRPNCNCITGGQRVPPGGPRPPASF